MGSDVGCVESLFAFQVSDGESTTLAERIEKRVGQERDERFPCGHVLWPVRRRVVVKEPDLPAIARFQLDVLTEKYDSALLERTKAMSGQKFYLANEFRLGCHRPLYRLLFSVQWGGGTYIGIPLTSLDIIQGVTLSQLRAKVLHTCRSSYAIW